jgi:hypothetical protein
VSLARCQNKMMGMLLMGLIQQTSIVMTCLVIDVRKNDGDAVAGSYATDKQDAKDIELDRKI